MAYGLFPHHYHRLTQQQQSSEQSKDDVVREISIVHASMDTFIMTVMLFFFQRFHFFHSGVELTKTKRLLHDATGIIRSPTST
jgi:hypothetical protein